jgi:hypothetical protein
MATEYFTIEYIINRPGPTPEEVLQVVKIHKNGISAYDLNKYFVENGQSITIAKENMRMILNQGLIKVGQGRKLFVEDA